MPNRAKSHSPKIYIFTRSKCTEWYAMNGSYTAARLGRLYNKLPSSNHRLGLPTIKNATNA